jgi:4-hydroxyphenylpyruvate dioxygenase
MAEKNNPLGIKGIDHLEFTVDSFQSPTKGLFYTMGFQKTHESDDKNEHLYSQGQCRFLMTQKKTGQSRDYFNAHGEGVSKMSFRVENCEHAIETAVHRGGKAVGDMVTVETEEGITRTACIQGFGDVLNEFVERPNTQFRPHMNKTEDYDATPLHTRVSRIDHLTNNVPHGEMEHWVDFYERVYGFKQTRYFDIKGVKNRTAVKSCSACGQLSDYSN